MILKFLKILFVLVVASTAATGQISTKEVERLLYKYEIKNPEIVLRIGILESGRFKSKKAIKYNNIFGFETGVTHFKSYDECILAYKNRVESRIREGENYYKFLRRIKYAADKRYIYKLKHVKI